MPKNANVICEGSLIQNDETLWDQNDQNDQKAMPSRGFEPGSG